MRPLLKKLLLLGVTVLICTLLIELIFRIYWPYTSIYVPDDSLNYKPKPNFEGVYKSPEGEVKFWTNKEGFVDQDPKTEKAPGTTRIFITGDSFVEGLYNERDKHFTTLLQQKLNSGGTGKYEVVSYGTSSWGTDNEYKYITTQGLKYNPDAVVLEYYQNDLENVAVSRLFKVDNGKIIPTNVGGTALGNKVKKAITKCSFYSHFCSYFQIHAAGFGFLHPILYKLGFSVGQGNASISKASYKLGPYLKEPQNHESELALDQAWNKTEMLLQEIKNAVEAKGGKLAIAYVPARWEVGKEQKAAFLKQNNLTENDVNMNAFRNKLVKISERNNIQLIDPTDKFAEAENEGKELYQSFVHFTKEGDELFSDALYEGLESAKFKNAAETKQ